MALVWVAGLTGNSPRPHRFRWPMYHLAGWTDIARSQGTVEDQTFERSSASRIEFHASDNRCGGRVGRGFSTSIEPRSRADHMQRVVQTGWLTKAE
jgi:hypothetical protein